MIALAHTPDVSLLDVDAVRADFPFTSRTVHNMPLVFLDSAASAQKPQVVIDAMVDVASHHYANVHRGVHVLSQEATNVFEASREKVRAFLNAPSVDEIIFTRGATEAINLVVNTWGRKNLRARDAVVISEMEHHANIVPWQMLQSDIGFDLRIVTVSEDGALDWDHFQALLDDTVKMVAISGMSNVFGTALPLDRITNAAHAVGSLVLVDACQLAVHRAVDVQALNIDFITFSGHKLYGPTGIGVLYGKMELLVDMPPWQGGGDMIDTVSFKGTTYAAPPARFEAGTPAIVEAVGLGAAIDYISSIGWDAIEAHEADLLRYAMQKLAAISGLKVYGTNPDKGAVLSLTLDNAHPDDIGMLLDRMGIAVRTGHHCAQPLMQKLGVPGTVRASFGIYTKRSDVDALVRGLAKVQEMFA